MSLEKRKIIISYTENGSPVYKSLCAHSQDEMNVKIVQAFVESGRILQICPYLHTENHPHSKILLKEYAIEWLGRKRRLKETTRTTYLKFLELFILPVLGKLKVSEITVTDVQRMLDKHSHLARKTLVEMKSTLHQIMKYAVSDEIIRKNPCESVDIVIPSDKVKERKALPLTQFQEILSHLQDLTDNDRRFLALCLFTGMRRGEALGLRWEDIYDDKIHIQRNVTHPQRNQPYISTPKTKAGIRTIPMPQPLIDALCPYQEKGYLFGGETPYTLKQFTIMWRRINKVIDMHGATPHVLRHSYLTYAVGVTTDFKTIQGISGHADVFTLVNRYAHPQETKVIELTNEIADILTEKLQKQESSNPL